jgi:hypothetical protein
MAAALLAGLVELVGEVPDGAGTADVDVVGKLDAEVWAP